MASRPPGRPRGHRRTSSLARAASATTGTHLRRRDLELQPAPGGHHHHRGRHHSSNTTTSTSTNTRRGVHSGGVAGSSIANYSHTTPHTDPLPTRSNDTSGGSGEGEGGHHGPIIPRLGLSQLDLGRLAAGFSVEVDSSSTSDPQAPSVSETVTTTSASVGGGGPSADFQDSSGTLLLGLDVGERGDNGAGVGAGVGGGVGGLRSPARGPSSPLTRVGSGGEGGGDMFSSRTWLADSTWSEPSTSIVSVSDLLPPSPASRAAVGPPPPPTTSTSTTSTTTTTTATATPAEPTAPAVNTAHSMYSNEWLVANGGIGGQLSASTLQLLQLQQLQQQQQQQQQQQHRAADLETDPGDGSEPPTGRSVSSYHDHLSALVENPVSEDGGAANVAHTFTTHQNDDESMGQLTEQHQQQQYRQPLLQQHQLQPQTQQQQSQQDRNKSTGGPTGSYASSGLYARDSPWLVKDVVAMQENYPTTNVGNEVSVLNWALAGLDRGPDAVAKGTTTRRLNGRPPKPRRIGSAKGGSGKRVPPRKKKKGSVKRPTSKKTASKPRPATASGSRPPRKPKTLGEATSGPLSTPRLNRLDERRDKSVPFWPQSQASQEEGGPKPPAKPRPVTAPPGGSRRARAIAKNARGGEGEGRRQIPATGTRQRPSTAGPTRQQQRQQPGGAKRDVAYNNVASGGVAAHSASADESRVAGVLTTSTWSPNSHPHRSGTAAAAEAAAEFDSVVHESMLRKVLARDYGGTGLGAVLRESRNIQGELMGPPPNMMTVEEHQAIVAERTSILTRVFQQQLKALQAKQNAIVGEERARARQALKEMAAKMHGRIGRVANLAFHPPKEILVSGETAAVLLENREKADALHRVLAGETDARGQSSSRSRRGSTNKGGRRRRGSGGSAATGSGSGGASGHSSHSASASGSAASRSGDGRGRSDRNSNDDNSTSTRTSLKRSPKRRRTASTIARATADAEAAGGVTVWRSDRTTKSVQAQRAVDDTQFAGLSHAELAARIEAAEIELANLILAAHNERPLVTKMAEPPARSRSRSRSGDGDNGGEGGDTARSISSMREGLGTSRARSGSGSTTRRRHSLRSSRRATPTSVADTLRSGSSGGRSRTISEPANRLGLTIRTSGLLSPSQEGEADDDDPLSPVSSRIHRLRTSIRSSAVEHDDVLAQAGRDAKSVRLSGHARGLDTGGGGGGGSGGSGGSGGMGGAMSASSPTFAGRGSHPRSSPSSPMMLPRSPGGSLASLSVREVSGADDGGLAGGGGGAGGRGSGRRSSSAGLSRVERSASAGRLSRNNSLKLSVPPRVTVDGPTGGSGGGSESEGGDVGGRRPRGSSSSSSVGEYEPVGGALRTTVHPTSPTRPSPLNPAAHLLRQQARERELATTDQQQQQQQQHIQHTAPPNTTSSEELLQATAGHGERGDGLGPSAQLTRSPTDSSNGSDGGGGGGIDNQGTTSLREQFRVRIPGPPLDTSPPDSRHSGQQQHTAPQTSSTPSSGDGTTNWAAVGSGRSPPTLSPNWSARSSPASSGGDSSASPEQRRSPSSSLTPPSRSPQRRRSASLGDNEMGSNSPMLQPLIPSTSEPVNAVRPSAHGGGGRRRERRGSGGGRGSSPIGWGGGRDSGSLGSSPPSPAGSVVSLPSDDSMASIVLGRGSPLPSNSIPPTPTLERWDTIAARGPDQVVGQLAGASESGGGLSARGLMRLSAENLGEQAAVTADRERGRSRERDDGSTNRTAAQTYLAQAAPNLFTKSTPDFGTKHTFSVPSVPAAAATDRPRSVSPRHRRSPTSDHALASFRNMALGEGSSSAANADVLQIKALYYDALEELEELQTFYAGQNAVQHNLLLEVIEAVAALHNSDNEIRRALTCSMCHKVYTEAQVLSPCGHTWCKKCLKDTRTLYTSLYCDICGYNADEVVTVAPNKAVQKAAGAMATRKGVIEHALTQLEELETRLKPTGSNLYTLLYPPDTGLMDSYYSYYDDESYDYGI